MQHNRVNKSNGDIAEIHAERRRNALALVRLLLYAAAEADELHLPESAALTERAAADVTAAFGLTKEEIEAFPA